MEGFLAKKEAKGQVKELFKNFKDPVSYTHLDVYKRQSRYRGAHARNRGDVHCGPADLHELPAAIAAVNDSPAPRRA